MFQVRRKTQVGYEDLLREMEAIEQQLLPENSALAMNLMVLEAKIRERFQRIEQPASISLFEETTPTEPFSDLSALIPHELPLLPDLDRVSARRRRKHTFETVGMAALLAVASAIGVFGLASLLQIALGWLA
jgi:hypothetical protein